MPEVVKFSKLLLELSSGDVMIVSSKETLTNSFSVLSFNIGDSVLENFMQLKLEFGCLC